MQAKTRRGASFAVKPQTRKIARADPTVDRDIESRRSSLSDIPPISISPGMLVAVPNEHEVNVGEDGLAKHSASPFINARARVPEVVLRFRSFAKAVKSGTVSVFYDSFWECFLQGR